jgi:hypothetical protein
MAEKDIRHKSVNKLEKEIHEIQVSKTDRQRKKKNKGNKKPPPAVGKHAHWTTAAVLNAQLRNITNLEERRKKAERLYHEHVLGIDILQKEEELEKELLNWSEECTLAYRKYMISSSHALSQGWDGIYIDDYSLFAPVTTLEDEYMTAYMNRADVKRALHVEETPIEEWPFPKAGFHYTKEYNACNWDDDIKFPNISMIDIYQEIVPKLDRTCT